MISTGQPMSVLVKAMPVHMWRLRRSQGTIEITDSDSAYRPGVGPNPTACTLVSTTYSLTTIRTVIRSRKSQHSLAESR